MTYQSDPGLGVALSWINSVFCFYYPSICFSFFLLSPNSPSADFSGPLSWTSQFPQDHEQNNTISHKFPRPWAKQYHFQDHGQNNTIFKTMGKTIPISRPWAKQYHFQDHGQNNTIFHKFPNTMGKTIPFPQTFQAWRKGIPVFPIFKDHRDFVTFSESGSHSFVFVPSASVS